MPPSRRLRSIIHWFQEAVVLPHERSRRVRPAPAESVLLPSRTLSPQRRLNIYVDGYLARLVEALEEDFPAVLRLVGPAAFHRLCRAYLERFPSRNRLLNPLGRNLPRFLSGPVPVPRREAVRDLARVEVAMSEVFEAPAAPPLLPGDFTQLDPGSTRAMRLRFVPAFRLMELAYPVNAFIDAVRHERRELPLLRHCPSWMAVYRKGFVVWRRDLEEPAYRGLSALLAGQSIGRSVEAVALHWRGRPSDLEARIRQWFGEWVSEGFFQAFSLGSGQGGRCR